LLKKIYPKAFEKQKEQKKLTEHDIKLKKLRPQVKVEGLSGIETKLAKCCHPIKGEPIVAYVTKKSEIKGHRAELPITSRISPILQI
jgi:GTP pyrophosphokinase